MSALSKALDWIHGHKKWLGAGLVFLAGGLRSLGYHDAADILLTIGTLTGVGYLPNGPNPKG